MVFAHYFTPYPVSLDNHPPASDYYEQQYLVPAGEHGKHAASGGLLRDRPLGREVVSGDWQLTDAETEVRQAVAAGLNGFTLDLLSVPGGTHWSRDLRLMDAAALVDPAFKIMVMPDMSSLKSASNDTVASMLATLASKPAAYRLADGRLVVSPFKGEARTPEWWSSTFNLLKSQYGISVAFVPTFVDFAASSAYASISYGFSVWGGGSPASVSSANGLAAHRSGVKWMQPVRVQDERPNQGLYSEARNTETLRAGWNTAIDTNAEWVQLTTWNDYSEGTSVAPSAHHGWTFLDISSYYATKYKTGSFPGVKRDALYITHRTQMHDAKPVYPQTSLMYLRSTSSAAVDQVEVTSFLTRDALMTARVGVGTYTWTAPAGMSTHVLPLNYGAISVSAVREGRTAQSVTSPFVVTAAPYAQDLQYVGVASRR